MIVPIECTLISLICYQFDLNLPHFVYCYCSCWSWIQTPDLIPLNQRATAASISLSLVLHIHFIILVSSLSLSYSLSQSYPLIHCFLPFSPVQFLILNAFQFSIEAVFASAQLLSFCRLEPENELAQLK